MTGGRGSAAGRPSNNRKDTENRSQRVDFDHYRLGIARLAAVAAAADLRRAMSTTVRTVAIVDTRSQPALGFYLAGPDVQRRKADAVEAMYRSLDDYYCRRRMMRQLVKVSEGVRTGRRWQLIACDLHALADAAEHMPATLLALDAERHAA